MKKSLQKKYLSLYFFTGLIGLIVITLASSLLIEQFFEQNYYKEMMDVAVDLAVTPEVQLPLTKENQKVLHDLIPAAINGQGIAVWICDVDGKVIFHSIYDKFSSENPLVISEFDPAKWGKRKYRIGKFYNVFQEETLSIITPIKNDSELNGYILIHYPMHYIYESRGTLLGYLFFFYVCIFLLFLFLMMRYIGRIFKPLKEVIDGVNQISNGNYYYRIPIQEEDEIGCLASTLNYMTEKLDQNSEYSRKVLSNVSHDFRSPLTSIKGYVEAILDGTIPYEMQDKYLKIVAYEADRLVKLTRGITALTSAESHNTYLNMESFNINEVISQISDTFEGACAKRNLQIQLHFHEEELLVYAVKERIQQVLYNLIDNAIKFSPSGSDIEVDTVKRKATIFVTVKDHGVGISKEQLPHIWERFYKTDPSRGMDQNGTGLGLTIAKEILKKHGQNIDVISTEGVGTEFIFTLDEPPA